MAEEPPKPSHFIKDAALEDFRTGRFSPPVVTRFPPEPNGYLHIGHAKAICLDFGLAAELGGPLPSALRRHQPHQGEPGVRRRHHARRPLARLRLGAAPLLRERLLRAALRVGGAAHPGRPRPTSTISRPTRSGPIAAPSPSPDGRARGASGAWRRTSTCSRACAPASSRTGRKVLRAKIDMAHPNLNLRDPVMYRVRKTSHHRTGDRWCIYPMYDWAHGESDSIEGVTHSLCTLEYEDHRPLYDWYLEALGVYHPRQIEFARLSLSHTVHVQAQAPQPGAGRARERLGRPAHADAGRAAPARLHRRRPIRDFCERIGVTKAANLVEVALLEHCLREDLNRRALRRDGGAAAAAPGGRELPGGTGRGDGGGQQPRGSGRGHAQGPLLARAVDRAGRLPRDAPAQVLPPLTRRARCGCARPTSVKCTGLTKDPATGEVTEVRCTYDPETRGRRGQGPQGQGAPSTGCRPRTRSRPRCGSTTRSSRSRSPTRPPTSRA